MCLLVSRLMSRARAMLCSCGQGGWFWRRDGREHLAMVNTSILELFMYSRFTILDTHKILLAWHLVLLPAALTPTEQELIRTLPSGVLVFCVDF